MIFPCVMYFYVVPALFGPEPVIDPSAEPASWTAFLIKLCLGIFCLFGLSILMLYFKQEAMLYKPSQPFQFPEQNPDLYQSPKQRGIPFEDVYITTEDGIKLHGWHMHHESKVLERDTVVFFHENAGNIGVRLDYFELLFKRVNVNVLCVGYRGYGHSQGEPTELGLK